MISKALNLIVAQLNAYIPPTLPEDPAEVVLGNIALNEASDQVEIQEKIVASLVNIEEESALKNITNFQKHSTGVKYIHQPVFLNLYILFAAHYPKSYEKALMRLSAVIRFFQHKKTFDFSSSPSLPPLTDPDDSELSISMDLFTMTFEQINHLWGTLGGKQMPFVMYKGRLVKLQDRKVMKEAPLIEEIQNNVHSVMPN
ncbi:MAG TPA: DUF4255 domain-containing protein [Cytophagales bacterium]|nr:DUF4255 domain-containing protein [Cytophagales bacterium]